jgi:hypothetical protein
MEECPKDDGGGLESDVFYTLAVIYKILAKTTSTSLSSASSISLAIVTIPSRCSLTFSLSSVPQKAPPSMHIFGVCHASVAVSYGCFPE